MHYSLTLLILIFSFSTNAFSIECDPDHQESTDLFRHYSKQFLDYSPFCVKAIKDLKKKPIEDSERYSKVIEKEKELIDQEFSPRENKSYDRLRKITRSIKKSHDHQITTENEIKSSSMDTFKNTCDKLKHCGVSCKLSYTCGFYASRSIGVFKEVFYDFILRKGTAEFDDLRANEIGLSISRKIATEDKTEQEIYHECEDRCASNIMRLQIIYLDYQNKVFCR